MKNVTAVNIVSISHEVYFTSLFQKPVSTTAQSEKNAIKISPRIFFTALKSFCDHFTTQTKYA